MVSVPAVKPREAAVVTVRVAVAEVVQLSVT